MHYWGLMPCIHAGVKNVGVRDYAQTHMLSDAHRAASASLCSFVLVWGEAFIRPATAAAWASS